jgi:probable HAF family extracellular repeat protein
MATRRSGVRAGLLAALAAGVVTASCGSGGGGGSPPTSPPPPPAATCTQAAPCAQRPTAFSPLLNPGGVGITMSPSTWAVDISRNGLATVVGTNGPHRGNAARNKTGVGAGYLTTNPAQAFGANYDQVVSFDISADGDKVVGQASRAQFPGGPPGPVVQPVAFVWTATGASVGGTFELPTVPGHTGSLATAINDDGSVIAGLATGSDGTLPRRWVKTGGVYVPGLIGSLGGNEAATQINGMSGDGSVLTGTAKRVDGTDVAFRWTQAGGMIDLGLLTGATSSGAQDVSNNGQVVVGTSTLVPSPSSPAIFPHRAFRWTQAGGMQNLGIINQGGDPLAQWSQAYGTNDDGSVVVGMISDAASIRGTSAFRWTQRTGMQNLTTMLTNAGVNLSGMVITGAKGVSGDGKTIFAEGWFVENVRDSNNNPTTVEIFSAFIVRFDDFN